MPALAKASFLELNRNLLLAIGIAKSDCLSFIKRCFEINGVKFAKLIPIGNVSTLTILFSVFINIMVNQYLPLADKVPVSFVK